MQSQPIPLSVMEPSPEAETVWVCLWLAPCNQNVLCCAPTGILNESLVTASHAIFVEKDGYRAPAAVVGLQYKNSAFRETFFNITSGVLD